MRKLVVVVLAVLVSCGVGFALWQYVVCLPVETGAVVSCPICNTVLADEVTTLRVPRWKCSEYHVDREEMLCARCANEIIAVHATTVVYCPDCGKQLRTFTATDQVKRADELAWLVEQKWQKETCSRCRHDKLLVKGGALYRTQRYGEAKAALEAAKKAFPASNAPDHWLAGIDDLKAQEQWAAAEAVAKADEKRQATRAAAKAEDERRSRVATGKWIRCPKCHGAGCWYCEEDGGILVTILPNGSLAVCDADGEIQATVDDAGRTRHAP